MCAGLVVMNTETQQIKTELVWCPVALLIKLKLINRSTGVEEATRVSWPTYSASPQIIAPFSILSFVLFSTQSMAFSPLLSVFERLLLCKLTLLNIRHRCTVKKCSLPCLTALKRGRLWGILHRKFSLGAFQKSLRKPHSLLLHR